MLDTYRTFGCESGQPTFWYSLLDGVRDGFLINPTVDRRTHQGDNATFGGRRASLSPLADDTGEEQEQTYKQREFEKQFFSDATNEGLLPDLSATRFAGSRSAMRLASR